MLRTVILSALISCALASSSRASLVEVDFTGGAGTPLKITLPQPVSFTVANPPTAALVAFVFQGVGDLTNGNILAASGPLGYTKNNGSPTAINNVATFAFGAVTANDLSLFSDTDPGAAVNDVFLLSSGNVITTSNVAATPPSGAHFYSALLVDGSGNILGTGTAVPEPASLCLILSPHSSCTEENGATKLRK